MFIVLDSTEFFDAPFADSSSFRLLKEYLRRTESSLLIPEVVLKETVNHTRNAFEQIDRDIQSLRQRYARLRSADAPELRIEPPDYGQLLRSFEAALRRNLQQFPNNLILPVPAIPHDVVLDRALNAQKPFHKNKDGYRDTLIWLTIAARVREIPGQYLFVTNNSTDFSEKDLLIELGALPADSSLRFMKDLTTFLDEVAKGTLEHLDNLRTLLRNSQRLNGFDLLDELSDLSSGMVQQIADKLRLSGYRYRDIEAPYYIEEYHSPEDIEVEEVYRTQDDVIVECTATFACTIEGYVFKSEAYNLQEQELVAVTDWNWNESYAEVEFSGDVSVKLLLRLVETAAPEEGEHEFEYSLESVDVLEATLEGVEY